MSNTIIRVENLGKKYTLGQTTSGFGNDLFFGSLKKSISSAFRSKQPKEEFWAVKDISFEINKGDRVAIIGRNGAGKSTLLKMLSRIVSPTKGKIEYDGKMASLLEVGTGFHGDLTGRENIYLNGSILGMSRREVDARFDEIVAFSEIEKFLDTPVKRYSSGMYVRLAFSVAAHLEPDILVVDEVLAVGDSAFQKKCLGKMQDVSAQEGRTILFVSHNLPSLTNLCNKGMVLKDGTLYQSVSPIQEAIKCYTDLAEKMELSDLSNRTDRIGEGKIKISGFDILDELGKKINVCISGKSLQFAIHYRVQNDKPLNNVMVSISINGADGAFYSLLGNEYSGTPFHNLQGKGTVHCKIPKWPLTSGRYSLNIAISQNGIMQDWVKDAVFIDSEDGDFYSTGRLVPGTHRCVLIEHNWHSNT